MTTITGGTPDFDLMAPLTSDTDVLDRIDDVIDDDARCGRSLWLLFLTADGIQLPVVVPIGDVPASPEPGVADSICGVIARVLGDAAPGGSAVIALVRDYGRGATDSDQQWLTALRAGACLAGVQIRMLCLATSEGVRRLGT